MNPSSPSFIPAETRLAILLTYINLNAEEAELARMLVGRIKDWEGYFQICLSNKVAPMHYYQLNTLGVWDKVPSVVQQKFIAAKDVIVQQNKDRVEEALKFLQRFVEEDIPVAIIKGSSFGPTVYGNPYYKRMNDIDLLIHRKDTPKIYKIYDDFGYFPLGERIKGNRKKSDELSHLSPHYVSRNLKCVIGTQWGIKTQLGPWRVNYPDIWARMRPMDYNGLNLKMLSPEDNLHHLCLHLGYFKIALRDMMDIYNVVRHAGNSFDWELFMKIVTETHSENLAYHALMIAHRLCPRFEFVEFAKRIEPRVSRDYLKTVRKKTADIDLLLNIFTDAVQSIDLAISRFDLTNKPTEKWKAFLWMWGSLLWPPMHDALRMALTRKQSFGARLWARISATPRLLRVIANEVGWKIVWLSMVITFYSVWKCTLKRPFRKKKDIYGWDEYAADLGLTLDELKKLEKHFQ